MSSVSSLRDFDRQSQGGSVRESTQRSEHDEQDEAGLADWRLATFNTSLSDPTRMFDQMHEKSAVLDDVASWLARVIKGEDKRVQQTFMKGNYVRFDSEALSPNVALVLLAGADKPSVCRAEETDMVARKPPQRLAIWRVNTAGALLTSFAVNDKLTFVAEDRTICVYDRYQEENNGKCWSPEQMTRVTIDSDKVSIVSDVRFATNDVGDTHLKLDNRYHLHATLIEVDASSLMDLIQRFSVLLQNSNMQKSVVLRAQLEEIMEKSRTFFARSPILFRMTTRLKIDYAADIRYGINDDDTKFMCMSNSVGIQRIISATASFYNSLNAADMEEVRTHFLQVLVLLLSLLAPQDLNELQNFLKATYSLNITRPHLQVTILKTIPLESINSEVFMASLYPAVTGYAIPLPAPDPAISWRTVLVELARLGYLLPATVDELGHSDHSWVKKWSETGYRSSEVFSRIQYHGDSNIGFNQLYPMNMGHDPDEDEEMTVFLNYFWGQPFIIKAVDYMPISTLETGRYSVTRSGEDSSTMVLDIKSEFLCTSINTAIDIVNRLLQDYNRKQPNSGSRKKLTKMRRATNRMDSEILSQEVEAMPIITRHEAWLEEDGKGTMIAVAWKRDGKFVARHNMVWHMRRPTQRISKLLEYVLNHSDGVYNKSNANYRNITQLIADHERIITRENSTRKAPDKPTYKALLNYGEGMADSERKWFKYTSEYLSEGPFAHSGPRTNSFHQPSAAGPAGRGNYGNGIGIGRLHVTAQRDTVRSVKWMADDTQAEVTLDTIPIKLVVATLRPSLLIPRDDELVVGDLVVLVGHYLIVTPFNPETSVEHRSGIFEMTNWLEILRTEEAVVSFRGRNKAKVVAQAVSIFK
jgi:hypothetical protein